jgi:hypothetical protein
MEESCPRLKCERIAFGAGQPFKPTAAINILGCTIICATPEAVSRCRFDASYLKGQGGEAADGGIDDKGLTEGSLPYSMPVGPGIELWRSWRGHGGRLGTSVDELTWSIF